MFNRPQEINELLNSLLHQDYNNSFEIIIIEDGSTNKSDKIIERYESNLDIKYFFKENSGPGQSRNYGMQKAKGNYFIILDSDVILPKKYLSEIDYSLKSNFTEAFTAPDCAHYSFTNIQKGINYAMTSFFTTGGLRNNKGSQNFQLRSFNMGISQNVFEKTNGFAKQNFGEDIDLSFRIEKLDLSKQFIANAYVFHKRRVNWNKFYKQIFNFGAARPILNKMYKNTAKITYWFPTVFLFSFLISLIALVFKLPILYFLFVLYFLFLFMHSLWINKNVIVAIYSIQATCIQFLGYGFGFLRSQFRLHILKKTNKETFPKMFS